MGKNIGKLVPSSKKMIKWGLIINLKKVEIMLKHSTVSGVISNLGEYTMLMTSIIQK